MGHRQIIPVETRFIASVQIWSALYIKYGLHCILRRDGSRLYIHMVICDKFLEKFYSDTRKEILSYSTPFTTMLNL